MEKITTVNEFQNLINKPGSHVVKASAKWCGPCQVLNRLFEEASDKLKELLIEIDVDEADEELINLLQIKKVPLLIFYNGNEEYALRLGIETNKSILEIVNGADS